MNQIGGIIVIVFGVVVVGVLIGTDTNQQIPLNATEVANEMCQNLDGVKSLKLRTDCVKSGKACTDVLVSNLAIVCNRHDAEISTSIRWQVAR
jgi:hypothetical protein